MAVTLGSAPLAGFDHPLQLLKDCHRRIEHFLGVLRAVVERADEGRLDDERRRALETALRYFREAAPRHTADEEESLFPRLRRSHALATREATLELDRLESDHRRADTAHRQIRQLGDRWMETGHLGPNDREMIRRLLDELAAAYAAHIRLEEEHVFEIASHMLTKRQLQEIGIEMEHRRATDSSGGSNI